MRQTIKITESELRNIIVESVDELSNIAKLNTKLKRATGIPAKNDRYNENNPKHRELRNNLCQWCLMAEQNGISDNVIEEILRSVSQDVYYGNISMNESINEKGLVKNLAMAGMLGAGLLSGMNNANAQQSQQDCKVPIEAQHNLYNRIHKSSGDTLSYNDYMQKIWNPTNIMKNNRNKDWKKISDYMCKLNDPQLINMAFPGHDLNYAMQNGGPENFMIIYSIVLPKTMTFEQFKECIENTKSKRKQLFSLSDFDF